MVVLTRRVCATATSPPTAALSSGVSDAAFRASSMRALASFCLGFSYPLGSAILLAEEAAFRRRKRISSGLSLRQA